MTFTEAILYQHLCKIFRTDAANQNKQKNPPPPPEVCIWFFVSFTMLSVLLKLYGMLMEWSLIMMNLEDVG